MRLNANAYVLIGCIAVMLFVLGWSLLMMEYFASKLLPIVISSIVLGLASIGLGREILTVRKQQETVSQGDREVEASGQPQETWHGYLLNGAWVVGFVLGLYFLGFLIAAPLFILSYMRWLRTRWHVTIICAILAPAILYAVFEVALKVELYRGLLRTLWGY
ncbi:tripartite tricarboxylate transporter TctB family protein [Chloroflexota bacterium]